MVKNALNKRHIIYYTNPFDLSYAYSYQYIFKRKNNSRKVLKRTFVTWYYVPV